MAVFAWLNQLNELSPRSLTVKQQARTAENPLNLKYRGLFPRIPAASIRISSITTVDFRPTADRREWNAQPREIPEKLGPARDFEMVPIGASHHIDERMLQKLGEPGVQALVQQGVIDDARTWPAKLADTVERRLEKEAFEALFSGLITVMDPKSGDTEAVPLGFDQATTYPTAGTQWADAGQNAYQNFLTSLQAAESKFGPVGPVLTRRAVYREIVADAPDGPNGLRPTFTSLQERVREEGFSGITLVIDERTFDGWTDGGSATSAAYYVPAGLIAFTPSDGIVGNTHVAPVVRAYDFLSGSDRSFAKGVVIFYSEKNEGKSLMIEAQENSIVLPQEDRVYVVDSGVTS